MEPEAENPLEQLLRAILGPEGAAEAARQIEAQGFDPSQMVGAFGPGAMMSLKHLFSTDSGPVNWQIATEISHQQAFQSGDPTLSAAQAARVKQALTVADLWLDPITDFVNPGATREAWTRVQWVDGTLPGWKQVIEPVASNGSRALTEAISSEFDSSDYGMPPEMAGMAASIQQAMPRMSAMVFGSQVGQALGAMSQTALGSSDSGIPMLEGETSALVLANVDAFGEGLDVPSDEVLQYVAVRECAHGRLFASVPWLRTDLLQALQKYSSEIALDISAIEETARNIDPSDPSSFQEVVATDVFAAEPTEDQQRALARLETMLALVEGWVEVVTHLACAPYLPHADQLREMMRRRRIVGSPGEQLLAQLVGLHLRPRAARDAAKLFTLAEGQRDELWAHPDHLPTAEQLSDVEAFLYSSQSDDSDDMDDELRKLLDGTLGWADGLEPPQ